MNNSSLALHVSTSGYFDVERPLDLVEHKESPVNSRTMFILKEQPGHRLTDNHTKICGIESLHHPGSFLVRKPAPSGDSGESGEETQPSNFSVHLRMVKSRFSDDSMLFKVQDNGVFDLNNNPLIYDGLY